jgi:hypothetical protein
MPTPTWQLVKKDNTQAPSIPAAIIIKIIPVIFTVDNTVQNQKIQYIHFCTAFNNHLQDNKYFLYLGYY